MIDGQIVNSCLVPVAQVEGAQIKTIEGITSEDNCTQCNRRSLSAAARSAVSARRVW